MSFDLKLFSSKLKKYREQRQVSIKEISQSTGILTQDLIDLEDEKKIPTGDQVLILADYYKCDYQFFLSNEKLAPFEQIEALYRKHGDEFSQKDRKVIQEFLFLCECEEFLFELIPRQHYKLFHFSKNGSYYKSHGEQASIKLRQHLDYSSNDFIRDIYDDFRRLGFHIFRRKLGNSSISGLYIKHPTAGKCILVNYDEDIYRQRFTVAHESAHAILDEEEDFVVSFTSWNKNDLVEIRANTFASHYLIPRNLLNQIPQPTNWDDEKVKIWANKLQVNTQPLAIALSDEKLISTEIYEQMKSIKILKNKKVDPELPADLSPNSRERKELLLKKGLSTFYVNLCFEAYEKSFISLGRLAEMLLVNEHELYQILEIYGMRLRYDN
ncbi:HigA protein [Geminocystis sp. NIES-3708]|uniref:ImmA/IrrE family metallo-endopeptidase n=1 Tax=Geminocystis sp. NIES-3708 TaxID=1615909 RepID=UPI0005FC748B|nr:ImmA/IrrE family metallo-endopeptidase [Geminocystis sp. NIES-3708]BAQ62140.1 HigA protein [Geminocystis sp. NIES-3708]